ncbi:uncharacterized protein TNCV_4749181 [Trichonephila clavipes]|nr:uncharacterized protein TNCV_4749181 [Trichonephila clavipes]
MRTCSWNLILPRALKPNKHSRDFLHAAQSCDMDAADFMHQENPPTWSGVEPTIIGAKLLGAVDTRRYPHAENRVWSDQEDHEERGSKDRVGSTSEPHSDSFNDTSRRRRSNCSTNNFQTPTEADLKSKRPFRVLPLTPEHRQLRLQWCKARSMWNVTDWQNFVLNDESRFVLGTDDNLLRVWRLPARVAQDFLRHFQTLALPARFPDLFPVEHVWDQLKRQMPSCHSVHDLELAVQDLWAHLPQDNIRCLINSMPDRVAACIAAEVGPTWC